MGNQQKRGRERETERANLRSERWSVGEDQKRHGLEVTIGKTPVNLGVFAE